MIIRIMRTARFCQIEYTLSQQVNDHCQIEYTLQMITLSSSQRGSYMPDTDISAIGSVRVLAPKIAPCWWHFPIFVSWSLGRLKKP